MLQIGEYQITTAGLVWGTALVLLLAWAVCAVLARVSYHCFRRVFPSPHSANVVEEWAEGLSVAAKSAWDQRPSLLERWTGLIIGTALSVVAAGVILFNLNITSRIFDFILGSSFAETVEVILPIIGVANEVSRNAYVMAIVFVSILCGLGIVLFALCPGLLQALTGERADPTPMSRGQKWLVAGVVALLTVAVFFEAGMNYLQADIGEEATALMAGCAALVGLLVPLGEAIFSGIAWHALIAPATKYLLLVLMAAVYRISSGLLSVLGYPHTDIRVAAVVAGKLNSAGSELNDAYRRLRRIADQALVLPAVRDNEVLAKLLSDIRTMYD